MRYGLEEIDALFTEAVFIHRQVLLEGYHLVGQLVLEEDFSIEEVAKTCHQRPKTVHYCVELAKAYPDLRSLPDGKNVSWYKICKTLPPYEKKQAAKKRR